MQRRKKLIKDVLIVYIISPFGIRMAKNVKKGTFDNQLLNMDKSERLNFGKLTQLLRFEGSNNMIFSDQI